MRFDLNNPKFDRSYAYDHAGRLTEALSGAEARNEGFTTLRPYKETFVYDALNHLVERPVNNVWSGGGGSFSPSPQTYQNERNTAWQYDADGNLTDSVNVQYTIDAAGQANRVVSLTMLPYNPDSTIWGVTNDLSRSLDGDGAVVKQVDAETTHDPANGDETTTNTTYLVRSSVLGGKVLTEISSETGQRGFVYLGNEVLAQQLKVGTTESVKWEHRDAGNASFRMTLGNGTLDTSERAELDPLGTNAGLSDPNTPPSLKKLSLYPGFGASQMSSDTQCMLDGMVTPCSTVVHTMSVGAAAQCPSNNCGPRFDRNRDGPGRGGWRIPFLFAGGFSYEPFGPSSRPTGMKPPHLKTVSHEEAARRRQVVRDLGSSGWGDEGDELFPQNTLVEDDPQNPYPSPKPQPHPSPTAQRNDQQQGFNDCAKQAYRAYRKTYLKTSSKAIVGGAGVGLGLGIGGIGYNLAGHALADTGLPVLTRLGTAAFDFSHIGMIGAVPYIFGGQMALDSISEANQNSNRTEAALSDCRKRYPNANHSFAFLNF